MISSRVEVVGRLHVSLRPADRARGAAGGCHAAESGPHSRHDRPIEAQARSGFGIESQISNLFAGFRRHSGACKADFEAISGTGENSFAPARGGKPAPPAGTSIKTVA